MNVRRKTVWVKTKKGEKKNAIRKNVTRGHFQNKSS